MSVETFRDLHRAGRPLLLPNAWDFASAAVLVDAGFTAIGTTSLGITAAHGVPDAQGGARAETLAFVRRLARLRCLVTVDLEAGSVAEAEAVAATGAVGINLEDGRAGGSLAPVEEQRATIAAVKHRVPGLFVNARIDTFWLAAGDLATTVARAEAYLDAGADGIFVPGIADPADIARLVATADVAGAPLNVLFLPGRHTVAQLADLGVRRISCGSLLFRAALGAVRRTIEAVAAGASVDENLPSYTDVERLVG